MVFIFVAYFSLYIGLQFHPSQKNWFKWILFNGWVIFHGEYVPQLPYPFICWWTSRLLPCPGYDKQCCDEHWGARVSFRSGFLGVYAQQWDCWVLWQFYEGGRSWWCQGPVGSQQWNQGGARGKEPACRCRRRGFNPWLWKMPWRGAWQPTPFFLPGKSHGQSLEGCSPWGFRESDMTQHSTARQNQISL